MKSNSYCATLPVASAVSYPVLLVLTVQKFSEIIGIFRKYSEIFGNNQNLSEIIRIFRIIISAELLDSIQDLKLYIDLNVEPEFQTLKVICELWRIQG